MAMLIRATQREYRLQYCGG